MRIHNVTRDMPVAGAVQTAANPWRRFRGLMLRSELAEGEALDIRGDSSIHMMFMRFPIDAVFYDGDGRVTSVKHGLKPWTGLAFGGRGTKGVIEMPVGAAEGIEPGDQLEWAA
jgi:uncharacterized membrane protein (UPF0127 family)